MSERWNRESLSIANSAPQDKEVLRALSRSPHPYHRHNPELRRARHNLSTTSSRDQSPRPTSSPESFVVDGPILHSEDLYRHSTDSDSGTEADDEHFLLGLPAPRSRPRKGLRGLERSSSTSPSPALSVVDLQQASRQQEYISDALKTLKNEEERRSREAWEKFRATRKTEVLRRVLEVVLLLGLGQIVYSGNGRVTASLWKNEFTYQAAIMGSLMVLYPIRLSYYLASQNSFKKWPSLRIPATFDPAPLLYPSLLTNFVTTLLSCSNQGIVLPNIILGISSLMPELLPSFAKGEDVGTLRWLLSCIPLFAWQSQPDLLRDKSLLPENNISPEILVLICPLHQVTCSVLRYLTTTSLLETELQLLSISLINILLLSASPQIVILQALMWGGGLSLLISCGFALRWVIALERIPRWRFKRSGNALGRPIKSTSKSILKEPLGKLSEILHFDRPLTLDSEDDVSSAVQRVRPMRLKTNLTKSNTVQFEKGSISAVSEEPEEEFASRIDGALADVTNRERNRRNTFPSIRSPKRYSGLTASGRKRRSASSSLQGFYNLTVAQATIRKGLYAAYVYFCVLLIIFAGVRTYVGNVALSGAEPIGWALAYMFGNYPWLRMQVLTLNLDHWIPVPEHLPAVPVTYFHGPWISQLRSNIGLANTRLLISTYWLAIIILGLTIVINLSSTVEVDTRRKVFHFMMVAMLLPATYIDPTFAALALSLILAVFLLLDLFRATQLPPLSKPIAYFLTPYVDGRDLRGPVVISHIFLLIGCAVPLWLSLGAVTRADDGWEIPTRDVSMVSGVICVGMGDAAASLIGRRYGRRKWLWPGGKSLEGSFAFAVAVTVALMAAKVWLRVGGWEDGGAVGDGWGRTLGKAVVAAGMASTTEAVLTGGNDNVVVPVVFWLCVKGLSI
ncbi:hypothetical protein VE01_07113 [Pseudogymnoascus verrucosus]|uniref:dolichol kinase n=1 Tax=Pseudogymnoascus verrucosus TaxID=342668 RepID=A0A1B8GDS9_9PEZI|nr:uncharacterized protein VE01_07113 [Pseudogymnoascus verrucosus]OBT93988.1 hypothetical protein VE01_07113 [Pseudogymnoascus verrucosus]